MKVDGEYVKSMDELIAKSLEPDQAAEVMKAKEDKVLRFLENNVNTRFVPGGEQQLVFRIDKTPENARFWEMLALAQDKWDIEYCYCSVFDDCWEVRGKFREPAPVEECKRDEPHEFMP